MKFVSALAVLSASLSTYAVAQTERDLGSHVHGLASLNVAVADSTVLIELSSPWDNLVGFEHAPSTAEQQAMVDAALQKLDDPAQLFAFNGGGCTLDEVMLESDLDGHAHDDEHEHMADASDEHQDSAHGHDHDEKHSGEHGDEHGHDHDHDEKHSDEHSDGHGDEHSDGHGHGHSDEHGHDEHHSDHESDTHAAVLATYSYNCSEAASLTDIDLLLFTVWGGFEELEVQLIGENGQARVELTPQNTVLNVAQVQ